MLFCYWHFLWEILLVWWVNVFVVHFLCCLRVWQELHFILTHTSSYKRLLWHDSVVYGHLTQMLSSWWPGRWRFQSCSVPSVKYCKIIFHSLLLCSFYFCNSFEENVWEELCFFTEICIYLVYGMSEVFYLVRESLCCFSIRAFTRRIDLDSKWTDMKSMQEVVTCSVIIITLQEGGSCVRRRETCPGHLQTSHRVCWEGHRERWWNSNNAACGPSTGWNDHFYKSASYQVNVSLQLILFLSQNMLSQGDRIVISLDFEMDN